MPTKRYNKKTRNKRNQKKTMKLRKMNKNKNVKKQWITAVGAAEKVYEKTGSYSKARQKLRQQALRNARRLFGSVGEVL